MYFTSTSPAFRSVISVPYTPVPGGKEVESVKRREDYTTRGVTGVLGDPKVPGHTFGTHFLPTPFMDLRASCHSPLLSSWEPGTSRYTGCINI